MAPETAYRLLADETVSDGIRRVVLGRIDNAIAELRGDSSGDPAEAVHEARKDLKKIRSALRLVRDQLGDEVFDRENGHYRELGRTLSSFRDAEVMVETVEKLEGRFGSALHDRLAGLRTQLEEELAAHAEDGSRGRAMAAAAAGLEQGRPRAESWPLEDDGWELLEPGLRRIYRRGRKRLRTVEEDPSVTNLHEWRKRAKDLWYALRLIEDADPRLIGTMARHAHDLSDHLGDDHDLALLREEVVRRRSAFAEATDQRLVLEVLDRRRGELRFAAISLGNRIYEAKPKRFVADLESRWRSWRAREPVPA